MKWVTSAACVVCLAIAIQQSPVAQPAAGPDPSIQKLLENISEQRLAEIVKKLQSFETRHTLSSPTSGTRGIGAARQWILDEMTRASSALKVSFDTYNLPKQGDRIPRDVELRNVMAILPGKSARRIYVSGHYDSLARRPKPAQPSGSDGGAAQSSGQSQFDWADADNFAPGANDDGSGTALTMELARVFGQSGIAFDATLVFITFAGEEEGLVGAKAHAQRAEASKLAIDAVFNNDIVGNPAGGNGIVDAESVRVFSDGPEDSRSRQLARFIQRQAARYLPSHRVRLVARHDRFGRGGDHTAFNQHGYAGVRFTESNENYSRQHTVADTADGVSPEYLARNARVNAACVAVMALAPPAPVVVDDRGRPTLDRRPSGYDARLRWQPAPGAAGYRVVWRDAWTPDWQHEIDVGNVTEFVMKDVSIDDYVFGVSAVGASGHESVVAAYVNPPRSEQTVIVK
jgi:Zn-dependent M28 family amino/carboxypeptidase